MRYQRHPALRCNYSTEVVRRSRTGFLSLGDTPGADASVRITKPHKTQSQSAETRVTFTRQELSKELVFLRDPFDLAEQTKIRLQKRDAEENIKALELVRLASGRMKCTVSWNHLINHHLLKNEVTMALKLYNEVPIPC